MGVVQVVYTQWHTDDSRPQDSQTLFPLISCYSLEHSQHQSPAELPLGGISFILNQCVQMCQWIYIFNVYTPARGAVISLLPKTDLLSFFYIQKPSPRKLFLRISPHFQHYLFPLQLWTRPYHLMGCDTVPSPTLPISPSSTPPFYMPRHFSSFYCPNRWLSTIAPEGKPVKTWDRHTHTKKKQALWPGLPWLKFSGWDYAGVGKTGHPYTSKRKFGDLCDQQPGA